VFSSFFFKIKEVNQKRFWVGEGGGGVKSEFDVQELKRLLERIPCLKPQF